MPEIIPFCGIIFNKNRVQDIDKAFAPPYDAISEKEREMLYRGHKYNIVRLILGKDRPSDNLKNNKYLRASGLLSDWIKKEILIQDAKPAFYIYAHEYVYDGKVRARVGFLGLLKLKPQGRSSVHLHERTYKKPKMDRLNLIKATNANLCSIFSIFIDKDDKVTRILRANSKDKPLFDVKNSGGVRHRIWRITDPATIKNIQLLMKKRDIFIADGHHRYEVSLQYRSISRNKKGDFQGAGPDYVMMYFLNLKDPGLLILPTYRILKKIPKDCAENIEARFGRFFNVRKLNSKNELFKKMADLRLDHSFGLFLRPDKYYLFTLRKPCSKLDVDILHNLIFKNILKISPYPDNSMIMYTPDREIAINEVKSGRHEAAFFIRPTKVEEVCKIASAGKRMPHKSTYFYPKLLSGLTINKL